MTLEWPTNDSPWLYLDKRDVVRIEGPDAISFIDGQVSQAVAALSPGESGWTLVLQPDGKIASLARVDRIGEDALRLDLDSGAGEVLLARLSRFFLRTKAELELTEGEPVMALRGRALADELPSSWGGIEGVDVFSPTADLLASVSGSQTVDAGAFEALRIRHRVPRYPNELDDGIIPAELGQEMIDKTVSFTKGCYTGQELVARVDSRGNNVPHHLKLLRAIRQFEVGPIEAGTSKVGRVTSVAQAPSGEWLALGYLHRNVTSDSQLEAAGVSLELVD